MKAVILALALSCAGAFAPVNKAAVRAPVELEAKKSVADLSEADLKGKKVLIRCDLNVPIKEGVIGDDTRIRASVPTVKYLLDKGAKVAMCSHLGRPKDGPEDKFSLGPVAARMGEQLGTAVKMAPDCIGDEVKSIVDGMGDGEALLLENTRFYKEETKNDAAFVEKLAAPFDLFVNDAFGTATARTPPPRASRSTSRPPSRATSSRRSSSTSPAPSTSPSARSPPSSAAPRCPRRSRSSSRSSRSATRSSSAAA